MERRVHVRRGNVGLRRPAGRKECGVWPVHVPTESRSRRPPAIDHRLVMSLRDAALGPSRPGHGAAEGGGSQAAEALITEAEQGQPCGNCVQLTDGTGGGGASASGFLRTQPDEKLPPDSPAKVSVNHKLTPTSGRCL